MLDFANILQSYLGLLWFSISELNWDFCVFSQEKEMCKSNVCTTMYVALQCVRIPALMNAKNPLSQRGSSSSYCLAGRPVTIYRLTGP